MEGKGEGKRAATYHGLDVGMWDCVKFVKVEF